MEWMNVLLVLVVGGVVSAAVNALHVVAEAVRSERRLHAVRVRTAGSLRNPR